MLFRSRIRVESDYSNTGISIGNSGKEAEFQFFQNNQTSIVVTLGKSNCKQRLGTYFTYDQILEAGIPFSLQSLYGYTDASVRPIITPAVPVRVGVVDSEVQTAIQNGVIPVCAAGNSSFKIDVPGGQDWNNYFELGNLIPTTINYPYYYNQGSSPSVHDSTALGGNYDIMDNIVVGAIDGTINDTKAVFSNAGPGVDIWAPGAFIQSSTLANNGSGYTTTIDPRAPVGSNNVLSKIAGTSQATPHVTGILACALETYPHFTANTGKNYILKTAKNQVTDTPANNNSNLYSLWNGNNLIVHYQKERPALGVVYPKANTEPRGTSRMMWPRVKIRKTQ